GLRATLLHERGDSEQATACILSIHGCAGRVAARHAMDLAPNGTTRRASRLPVHGGSTMLSCSSGPWSSPTADQAIIWEQVLYWRLLQHVAECSAGWGRVAHHRSRQSSASRRARS